MVGASTDLPPLVPLGALRWLAALVRLGALVLLAGHDLTPISAKASLIARRA
jgi:hypothetical protein